MKEDNLQISEEESALLAGQGGPGRAKAMEILVALGRVQGARELLPIESAHVSGISLRNIGEAGLHFLKTMARGVDHIAVHATINPCGIDLQAWKDMGADPEFVRRQREIVDVLAGMGFDPVLSCAPYHCGNRPERGGIVAWAESSAVAYANSVIGARTQREGGPSALAAAMVGRTPGAGPLLDECRRPTIVFDLPHAPASPEDCGALGTLAGRAAGGGVPFFQGADLPEGRREQSLRSLGAAMAASGAVALFHWKGVTPEAADGLEPEKNTVRVKIESYDAAWAIPGVENEGPVDLVALGCPHASLDDVREISGLLEGRSAKSALWIMTSRAVAAEAEAEGLGERIRAANGRIVRDACVVVAPLRDLGFSAVAVNSAKAASYLPSHQGVRTFFGDLGRCLRAAEKGWFDPGGRS